MDKMEGYFQDIKFSFSQYMLVIIPFNNKMQCH